MKRTRGVNTAASLATFILLASAAAAEMHMSEPQSLGNGKVGAYAAFDDAGKPEALGVRFEAGMLQGLPAEMNTYSRCFDKNGNGRIDPHGECNGDYELIFLLSEPMRAGTPFKWISVNWNPQGHPPPAPPPWAVPHFDFHFYIQDRDSVRNIRPGSCSELIDCDDFKTAQKPVPARYVHADYIDVGAAVPDMGNHLVNSKAVELAPGGPPFTHTFIYGAYDGRITFYEPMITHAYFSSKPDLCVPLKLPQAWAEAGAYPTRYCMRYHEDEDAFTVSLEDFVERAAE